MHGHIGIRDDALDGTLDLVGQIVSLAQALAAVYQDVHIDEKLCARVPHADVVYVENARHHAGGRGDGLLQSRRGGVQQRLDGANCQFPSDADHDHGNDGGREWVRCAALG